MTIAFTNRLARTVDYKYGDALLRVSPIAITR